MKLVIHLSESSCLRGKKKKNTVESNWRRMGVVSVHFQFPIHAAQLSLFLSGPQCFQMSQLVGWMTAYLARQGWSRGVAQEALDGLTVDISCLEIDQMATARHKTTYRAAFWVSWSKTGGVGHLQYLQHESKAQFSQTRSSGMSVGSRYLSTGNNQCESSHIFFFITSCPPPTHPNYHTHTHTQKFPNWSLQPTSTAASNSAVIRLQRASEFPQCDVMLFPDSKI